MMMHSSACDCEASLCETLRGFSAQHPDSVIYQTSLMSALLSGVYEGGDHHRRPAGARRFWSRYL